VIPSRDGSTFWFLCNRKQPGDYEVCRVPARGGAVREVTSLDGVESFRLSPDGARLLVRNSLPMPPQAYVVDAAGAR
jgi:dipeptidyl aminopeptidase/acylaminoacyl peptidase